MRQFLLQKQLEKDGTVTLDGKDYKYLRQVLRARPGDMISLRLTDGTLKNSTVTKIDEHSRLIQLSICADTDDSITRGVQASQIESQNQNQTQKIEYFLLQFIPRPQKFEQIVRQTTECGVKYIIPVEGEFSEKSSIQSLRGGKKERLDRIIKEARQQSGSPIDTIVCEPMSLEAALEFIEKSFAADEPAGFDGTTKMDSVPGNDDSCRKGVGFVLSERDEGSAKIREILEKNPQVTKVAIACGSEGGISPKEVEILCKKGLFYPIHFTVNILRCETAALYGIAAVQTAV